MCYGYIFAYCLSCIIKRNFRSGISWRKSNTILLDTDIPPKSGEAVSSDKPCWDDSEPQHSEDVSVKR